MAARGRVSGFDRLGSNDFRRLIVRGCGSSASRHFALRHHHTEARAVDDPVSQYLARPQAAGQLKVPFNQ